MDFFFEHTRIVRIGDRHHDGVAFYSTVSALLVNAAKYSFEVDGVVRTINGTVGIDVTGNVSFLFVSVVEVVGFEVRDREILTTRGEHHEVIVIYLSLSLRLSF